MHYFVGVFALLVFLMTGVYMEAIFPDAYSLHEAIRYQFRANHIYILMSSLINLTLALSRDPPRVGWRPHVAKGGSAAVALAPLILIAAFLIEPPRGVSERPLTVFGVVLLVVGVLLSVIARVVSRSRNRSERSQPEKVRR